MFNESVGNLLQLLAFPLEAVGIGLAYLELRHRQVARQIANSTAELFRGWLEPEDGKPVPLLTAIRELFTIILLTAAVCGVLFSFLDSRPLSVASATEAALFGGAIGVGMVLFLAC